VSLTNVAELEAHIEQLRDTQRKYSNVLRLSRALASHFFHVVQTQVRDDSFHTFYAGHLVM